MRTERSKGITFFGMAVVMAGLLGLISLVDGSFLQILQGGTFFYVYFVFTAAASLVGLFAGVYILQLKNWARKVTIALYSANAVFLIIVEFQLNVDTGGFLGTYRL